MSTRIALVGVGRVGRIATAQLLDLGYEIVAAVGRGRLVGEDLGELAELGPLRITVRDDLEAALAETRPDVALMSTASTLEATEADLVACIRAGAHVVSAAEELLAPWASDPARADALDALAKQHGVSVVASGHVDALWVHLPLALTGVVTRLSALEGECTRPFAIDRSSNRAVAELLGRPVEEYPAEHWSEPRSGAAFSSLHAIARGMGLSATRVRSALGPAVHDQDLTASFADGSQRLVPAGSIAGAKLTVALESRQGVTLTLHDVARIGARSIEHWRATGTPDVELRARATQGLLSTATQMVNRVAEAPSAAPGLHTLSDLPPLRYRA